MLKNFFTVFNGNRQRSNVEFGDILWLQFLLQTLMTSKANKGFILEAKLCLFESSLPPLFWDQQLNVPSEARVDLRL